MLVELRASPPELAQLRERIGRAWTHLGGSRPHHSVLTGEEFLPQNLDEAATDRFWATGSSEVVGIESRLKRNGFHSLQSKTCVEYGCGLGRVTFPLAKIFGKIHAYDISATYLSLAKQRAMEQSVQNIEFYRCNLTSDLEALQPCDFFYSRIVFQYNPPPVIRELIIQALRSLRSGGIAMFQVPTYGLNYAFRLNEYLASEWRADMEMHFIPQSEVFAVVAEAHCQVVEVEVDNSIGNAGQWISNLFIVQRPVPAKSGIM